MSFADLSAADPIVAALTWLRQHPAMLAEFGDASRISGTNEAPYPRSLVQPSAGGDDRDMVWLMEPEISMVTIGDLDGTPGQAELRRLHYVALGVLAQIVGAPAAPDLPVVTRVTPSSSARFEPEPLTFQPAWRSTLLLVIHPPQVQTVRMSGRGTLGG